MKMKKSKFAGKQTASQIEHSNGSSKVLALRQSDLQGINKLIEDSK